jgi:hypothetical protein
LESEYGRVLRRSEDFGCSGSGSGLVSSFSDVGAEDPVVTRADCLLPFTIFAEGPSAAGSLHGGEGAREDRPDFVIESNFLFLGWGIESPSDPLCISPFSVADPFAPFVRSPFVGGGRAASSVDADATGDGWT